MKASLDQNGELVVSAETGVESYALQAWHNEFSKAVNQGAQCNAVIKIELLRSYKAEAEHVAGFTRD